MGNRFTRGGVDYGNRLLIVYRLTENGVGHTDFGERFDRAVVLRRNFGIDKRVFLRSLAASRFYLNEANGCGMGSIII